MYVSPHRLYGAVQTVGKPVAVRFRTGTLSLQWLSFCAISLSFSRSLAQKRQTSGKRTCCAQMKSSFHPKGLSAHKSFFQ